MATIQAQQEIIYKQAIKGGVYAASATCITLIALTAITGALLCLTLPGVNAMSQLVYPIIFPCTGALLLVVPSVLISLKITKQQDERTKTMLQAVKENLDTNLPQLLPIDRRDYILQTLLPCHQSHISASVLATQLKKLYPETPTGMDKKIITALDKAIARLQDKAVYKELDDNIQKLKKSVEAGKPILQALEQTDDEWKSSDYESILKDLLDHYPEGSPKVYMRALVEDYLLAEYPDE